MIRVRDLCVLPPLLHDTASMRARLSSSHTHHVHPSNLSPNSFWTLTCSCVIKVLNRSGCLTRNPSQYRRTRWCSTHRGSHPRPSLGSTRLRVTVNFFPKAPPSSILAPSCTAHPQPIASMLSARGKARFTWASCGSGVNYCE